LDNFPIKQPLPGLLQRYSTFSSNPFFGFWQRHNFPFTTLINWEAITRFPQNRTCAVSNTTPNPQATTPRQQTAPLMGHAYIFVGLLAETFAASLVAANTNCAPSSEKDT